MKISILGTGAMGTGMGEAIINAGHELVVYNRTTERTKTLVEKGAKCVLTPWEAIRESDLSIFVMVDGTTVKSALLNEKTAESVKDKFIINASTSSAKDTMEIADIINKNGGKFAEVSMLADPDSLRSAAGTFNLGCDEKDTQFLTDVLSTFTACVNRVGEVGDVSKIVAFSLVGDWMSLVSIAYSVATAQKMGIKPEVYEPIINTTSQLAQYYMPSMSAHNYDTVWGSVEGNMLMGYSIIETTKDLGMPTDVLEEMQKLLQKAAANGYSQKDASAILEVLVNH